MTPDSNYGYPKCRYQNPIKIKAKTQPKIQIPGPKKTMPAPDWHAIHKITSSSNNSDDSNSNNWQPRMRGGDEGK